jgi:hypothetical protein
MGKQFTIELTQEHINLAIPRDSGHCMWADATGDSIAGAMYRSVDLQTMRWTDLVARKRYIVLTPAVVQQSLIAFDQGRRDLIKPVTIRVRAAQVVSLRSRVYDDKERAKRKARTVRERAAKREAAVTQTTERPKPRTQRRLEENGAKGSVPTVLGGRTPPTAVLSNVRAPKGRIRRFGIRSLEA